MNETDSTPGRRPTNRSIDGVRPATVRAVKAQRPMVKPPRPQRARFDAAPAQPAAPVASTPRPVAAAPAAPPPLTTPSPIMTQEPIIDTRPKKARKKKTKGFKKTFEVILIFLLLAILAGSAWYVYLNFFR